MGSVSNSSGFGATVNGDGLVTLYNLQGEPVEVAESSVELLINAGFRRVKLDIDAQLSELMVAFDAAKSAAKRMVEGIVSDGVIDAQDNVNYAVAQTAMTRLDQSYAQIYNDLHALYPTKQATGVAMMVKDSEGNLVPSEVDPGQVDLYLEKGATRI
jgi:hypothetical protein